MEKDKALYNPIYHELIRVSNLYYSNCKLSDMLDYAAEVSGLTVVLTDKDFRVVAAGLAGGHRIKKRVASAGDSGDRTPDPFILLSKFQEGGEIGDVQSSEKVLFQYDSTVVAFTPMLLPNHTHYLCVDHKIHSIDSRFKAMVENALPFLALTIDKQRDCLATNFFQDFYAPFFQILLGSGPKTPDEIRNICNMYNVNPDLKRVCMTLQLQESAHGEEDIKALISRLRIFLAPEKYFLVYRNDFITVFLFYSVKDQDLDVITKSYILSMNLYTELDSKYQLRIGISSAHSGSGTIRESFEESFKSIKVQKQLEVPATASSYFEQSIYHILNIPELKSFRKLAGDIVAPLIEYDIVNETNFFQTLQQYFYNSFNIQRTAKALYIHRNTLTYRLQHIKELLKFDFDFDHNTDAIFTLYLCICVYKLGYHKDNP